MYILKFIRIGAFYSCGQCSFSTVEFIHRFVKRFLHPHFTSVSSALDGRLDIFYFTFGKRLQNIIDDRSGILWPADSETHPLELTSPQIVDKRADAIVAAVAAFSSYSYLSGRKIQIIVYDECLFRIDLVEIQ